MKIYEISFHAKSNDPADADVMLVWVQNPGVSDEVTRGTHLYSEKDVLASGKMESVSMDTVFEWVGELLNVPVGDEEEQVDALACAAVYSYFERTHFYRGSMVNAMIGAMNMRMPRVEE